MNIFGINKVQEPVLCSKCGKILDVFDRKQRFSIHKKIGYGSEYDGCTMNLNLCCDCMDWLIKQCKKDVIMP